ncbi:MAG: AAA family ATPase, partial [bacterium]
MEGKQLIKSLIIKNLLSFGSEGEPIELQPLNILIGLNASGKSNLIEIIGLLHSTPKDLSTPFRGGIGEWIWKGGGDYKKIAMIEAIVDYPEGYVPLRYKLWFSSYGQKLETEDETIENERPLEGEIRPY